MPPIYRYKGYTVEHVGLSHHIWRDFVSTSPVVVLSSDAPPGDPAREFYPARHGRPRGPHGYAQSKAEALRWINSDRGLMTPVESGWIEAIGYVPCAADRQRCAGCGHPRYEHRETGCDFCVEIFTGGSPTCFAFVAGPPAGFVLVRLKTGKTTAYLCPSWTYGAVMRSKSKGKAYHRLIKSHPEVPVPAGLITE